MIHNSAFSHSDECGSVSAYVRLDLPCLNRGGVRMRRVNIGRDYSISLADAKGKIEQVRRDNKELEIVAEFKIHL